MPKDKADRNSLEERLMARLDAIERRLRSLEERIEKITARQS